MPDQTPIKYDAGQHRLFAPGDTLPPSVLGLRQRVRPGLGIAIVDNGDGTLTIVNTCCDTQPPNGSVHTLTMSPVLANITEGESACWAVVLNAPVADAPLTVQFTLGGDEQAVHSYPAPATTFPIGATRATVCVATQDDAVDGPNRSLILQPAFGPRLTGWTPPGNQIDTIVVLDNDGGGDSGYVIVSMAPTAATIIEGQAACWDIVLDRQVQDSPLTVSLAFSGDEQTRHSYPAPSLTIPVGAFGGPVCVVTTDDGLIDADRTLTLTAFVDARIAAVQPPSSIAIRDNDREPPGVSDGALLDTGGCVAVDCTPPQPEVLSVELLLTTDGHIGGTAAGDGANWIAGSGVNAAEYEARVTGALADGPEPLNVWVPLNAPRRWQRRFNCGTSGMVGGQLQIRRILDARMIVDAPFGEFQVYTGLNAVCP